MNEEEAAEDPHARERETDGSGRAIWREAPAGTARDSSLVQHPLRLSELALERRNLGLQTLILGAHRVDVDARRCAYVLFHVFDGRIWPLRLLV